VKEGENLKQDFYAAEEKLDDANEIRKEKKRKEKINTYYDMLLYIAIIS
jgi:hypothetical protein